MSEAGYYMTVSMLDDPYRIKRACDKAGIKLEPPEFRISIYVTKGGEK